MVVNSLSKETTRDMIQTDVLLSEYQIAQEFMAALARHELPEKFFYWFPLSIRAGLQPVAQYDSVDKQFLTLLATRSP